EVEIFDLSIGAGSGDEFDGTSADVTDRSRGVDGRLAHALAEPGRELWCRGFLDHLLVSPLKRTVAFIKVDAVAKRVGNDLDLDMARIGDEFLDQHAVIAKGCLGFAPAACKSLGKIRSSIDPPHALSAAACHRLDHDRIADLIGCLRELAFLL